LSTMFNAYFILPKQSFVHKTAFPWNVSVILVKDLSAHPVYFVFLDRAFSIMKIKNKPTKCTN